MPDSEDPDARYAEILRRIQQQRAQENDAPKQNALSETLDALNAIGFLEEVRQRPPAGINCYGPKTFTSRSGAFSFSKRASTISQWVGVVVWYKPAGYFHYQTLGLLGIWAAGVDETIDVTVGTRSLAFSAPVFNPESYYHHIKRKFSIYYSGDASPPNLASEPGEGDTIWYQTRYNPSQRLVIRDAIQQTLGQWSEAARRDETDTE